MILLLWACGEPPPPPPPPKKAPEVVNHAPVMAAAPEVEPGGDPVVGGAVPVEVQFVGVGELHRRYFGDLEIVSDLSRGLGACVQERAVVRVSYDEDERIGRIRLLADGDQITCRPVLSGGAPPVAGSSSLDVSGLEPLGRSLAAYRDVVAGRFDFRVASFRIELELLTGTNGCVMQLGGQFPPDGTTWDPCVDLGGERSCAPGGDDGTATFAFGDPKQTAYLARCFDLPVR
ncbi:MAG: hypothetical protein R3F61_03670 [Myxococcota bacterium]